MRPLARLHRPRRLASVMLFVWLSAMLASWANACILNAPPERAHAPEYHRWATAEHGADNASKARSPDLALAPCEDFCEMERSVISRAQNTKDVADAGTAVIPQAAHVSWPADAPWRLGQRWYPPALRPPSGPPLTIAFRRLTR